LIELLENRDYPGSTHFFFDIGNDNLLGSSTSRAWFGADGRGARDPLDEMLGGRLGRDE
jgi:hypothetical protein